MIKNLKFKQIPFQVRTVLDHLNLDIQKEKSLLLLVHRSWEINLLRSLNYLETP